MNVLESITKSAEFLSKRGVTESRLNAELLLSDILKMSRLSLYLNFERELTTVETDTYRDYIVRRSKFEPLQYIVGNVEFYGLTFNVDKNVLIPRQETETLIETVYNVYKGERELNILDIGTGSGNVIISLIKNLPTSRGISIDINENALQVAEHNAELNDVKDRIKFIQKDILTDLVNFEDNFDIVVSNPPYIPIEEYPTLQKELVEYEPKDALTDFSDGFTFYRVILRRSKEFLKNNGRLFFETGDKMSDELKNLFVVNGYKNIKAKKDLLNIERVIFGEYIESNSPKSIWGECNY